MIDYSIIRDRYSIAKRTRTTSSPTHLPFYRILFSFYSTRYDVGCRPYLVDPMAVWSIVWKTVSSTDWQIKFCKFYGFCQFQEFCRSSAQFQKSCRSSEICVTFLKFRCPIGPKSNKIFPIHFPPLQGVSDILFYQTLWYQVGVPASLTQARLVAASVNIFLCPWFDPAAATILLRNLFLIMDNGPSGVNIVGYYYDVLQGARSKLCTPSAARLPRSHLASAIV